MKVTLDTNVIPAGKLIATCSAYEWDFAVVSVTPSEFEGTGFLFELKPLGEIYEIGVYGQSRYGEHTRDNVNRYNDHCKSNAKYGFTLVFKLFCEKCGHSDFVKISNTGWQGGQHATAFMR